MTIVEKHPMSLQKATLSGITLFDLPEDGKAGIIDKSIDIPVH